MKNTQTHTQTLNVIEHCEFLHISYALTLTHTHGKPVDCIQICIGKHTHTHTHTTHCHNITSKEHKQFLFTEYMTAVYG